MQRLVISSTLNEITFSKHGVVVLLLTNENEVNILVFFV